MISFGDDEYSEENKEAGTGNQLGRTKQVRVYHSSSDEDEEDRNSRPKLKKLKKTSIGDGDILKKLENFDGGFWKDEEVSLDPLISKQLKKEEVTLDPLLSTQLKRKDVADLKQESSKATVSTLKSLL